MVISQNQKYRTIALLLILISLLATLFNWFINYHPLQLLFSNIVIMKFNTTVCFILSTLSLAALHKPGKWQTPAAIVLSLVVVGFASLSIAQDVFHFSAGIDEWWLKDAMLRGTSPTPGRMGTSTSGCFILLNLALLLLHTKIKQLRLIAQYGFNLVTFTALVAFIGYLYGVPVFYRLTFLSSMALQSSLTFIALSVLASLQYSYLGLTGLFTGSRTGNIVARWLFPLMFGALLLLGYLFIQLENTGLLSRQFNTALLVASFLVVVIIILSTTASALNKLDSERDRVEKKLLNLNEHLELTIKDRTKNLETTVSMLMESEARFRDAFEYSAIGMALVSIEGRWLKVNSQVTEIVGYTEEELLGKTFQDLTHPDDLFADLDNVEKLLKGKINYYNLEKRYIHKNGHVVWVLLSVSLVRDSKGNASHFVAQLKNITERIHAQMALEKVNRELTTIFNSANHVSIVCTDLNGIITHFSRGAETMLGYTAAEMIGRETPVIIHRTEEISSHAIEVSERLGYSVSGFNTFVGYARHGGYESREWTYVRKDGSTFPVQLVVSGIWDNEGKLTGFMGVATDISERREIEESRRKYAQLEAKNKEMEQFSYIASHDLQEPLRTVSSYADLLALEYKDKLDENGVRYLNAILRSTNRMSDLIKGLLDYSRIGKERHLEQVDTNQLVETVCEDMAQLMKETGASVFAGHLPVLSVYKLEFTQLLQNLLSNAIKFKHADVAPVVEINAVPQGHKWLFSVKDNGIGIEEKNLDKLFIIFRRLHNVQQYPGAGIGLAHCKKIVDMHNGNIWVESTPGKGSTFYFTINV